MPNDSDVRVTSHERHDPMLVAALAAGDLAGTERDQAIALTQSCASCSSVHADLLAIARATAALPPPIAAPQRDFRLSPAQAASLRRTGWRRFVPSIPLRTATTRRLGVGLATIGMAGLLIGNVSFSLGSAASAPAAAPVGAAGGAEVPQAAASQAAASQPTGRTSGGTESLTARGSAVASAAPAATAQVPDTMGSQPSSGSGSAGYFGSNDVAASRGPAIAGFPSAPTDGAKAEPLPAQPTSTATEPIGGSRPLNLVFGGAIVLGLALLIVARRRGSAPTN
jgi:hypothetical protein